MTHDPADLPLTGRRGVVITASTRASQGVYPDRGGALIVQTLRGWGVEVADATVVPDAEIGETITAALALAPDVLLTTGGTGISPTDGTPEAVLPLLDRQLPGIAEAIRAAGVAAGVPTAMLSRGVAGIAGRTLVLTLPGSTGGVRDALAVLEPVLAHALSQVAGGDH